MATFPLLNSGAATQYPSPVTWQQSAQVIRFLDGTDQRYLTKGRTLRQWHIQLNLLTELETSQLEQFFESLEGQAAIFDFPDPYSGGSVHNCRLALANFVTAYEAVDLGSTDFWVVETNG